MSLAEIRDAEVSLPIAREAHEQASARLADVLDTKKTHEQKAYTLFTGYITLTLALFGAAGAFWTKGGDSGLSIAFGVAGVAFAVGAICFVFALKVSSYGAAGSDPSAWLVKSTLEGDERELARMLAYVTFHHQNRIEQSIASNKGKARWIRRGIFCGAAGPLLLALVFGISAARGLFLEYRDRLPVAPAEEAQAEASAQVARAAVVATGRLARIRLLGRED